MRNDDVFSVLEAKLDHFYNWVALVYHKVALDVVHDYSGVVLGRLFQFVLQDDPVLEKTEEFQVPFGRCQCHQIFWGVLRRKLVYELDVSNLIFEPLHELLLFVNSIVFLVPELNDLCSTFLLVLNYHVSILLA